MSSRGNGGRDVTDDEYRSLHTRLRRYFEWNRCESPEDLAQESILRGLKRLEEGQKIYAENPNSYFLGIARYVLKEERKKHKLESGGDEDSIAGADEPAAIQWRILLRECLSLLRPKDRDLIVTYILNGAEAAAEEHGVTQNAVRIRVCRIREQIAKSLQGPLGDRK